MSAQLNTLQGKLLYESTLVEVADFSAVSAVALSTGKPAFAE